MPDCRFKVCISTYICLLVIHLITLYIVFVDYDQLTQHIEYRIYHNFIFYDIRFIMLSKVTKYAIPAPQTDNLR